MILLIAIRKKKKKEWYGVSLGWTIKRSSSKFFLSLVLFHLLNDVSSKHEARSTKHEVPVILEIICRKSFQIKQWRIIAILPTSQECRKRRRYILFRRTYFTRLSRGQGQIKLCKYFEELNCILEIVYYYGARNTRRNYHC